MHQKKNSIEAEVAALYPVDPNRILHTYPSASWHKGSVLQKQQNVLNEVVDFDAGASAKELLDIRNKIIGLNT